MVPLDSPVTAHTMSIASLGLTGHGRVRCGERVGARRPVSQKELISKKITSKKKKITSAVAALSPPGLAMGSGAPARAGGAP